MDSSSKNGRFHVRREGGVPSTKIMTMETIHCGMEFPFTIRNLAIINGISIRKLEKVVRWTLTT
jgi:hypothetical protein